MTAQTTTAGLVVHASHRVLAIHPDADAVTALAVMADNGVRHLPVVHGNRCQGLVIEADLLRAVAFSPAGPPSTVGALCHRRPPAVSRGAAPSTIAAAILAGGLDAALVVQGGALTGIVTSKDVLAAVATSA